MDEKIIKLYNNKIEIKFNPNNHSYWLIGKLGRLTRLTGVTTYLGILDKPALIPWAVGLTVDYIRDHLDVINQEPNKILKEAQDEAQKQRDIAAEIGKAIHAWIESHIKGEEPEMPQDPKVLQGVNAFLDWVADNKVKFLWSEKIVYSKKFGYVGTADLGVQIGKKKYLADIKTGNGIYTEAILQTAAYLEAINEENQWIKNTKEKYDGRIIIRISKETEEEYNERMQKKLDDGKIIEIPKYEIFKMVILDNREQFKKDFEAFLAVKKVYEWKKQAELLLKN